MLDLVRDQTLTPRTRDKQAGRGIAGGLTVSLLLHAAVLAALLLRLKWNREPDPLPPPATVNVVWEGGRPEGPTTTKPQLVPEPSAAPPSAEGGPPGAAAQPPPPETAAATPSIPAPAAPESPPSPAPTAEQPPPRPLPPVALAEPPPVPPPPPPAPNGDIVPPPQNVAPPVEPAKPEPAPVQPAQKRESWPPARPPATPQKPSDFPPPIDFSFGPPSKPGASSPGKPILSLGLPNRGPEDSTPFSLDTNAEVGPDWRNALSEWVHDHAYYPEQAAQLGQEGTTRVLVTTTPEGRVLSVEMEKRSGSPWLDIALESLFRGAKLPPMPKSVGDQPVPFHFTMHYILIR